MHETHEERTVEARAANGADPADGATGAEPARSAGELGNRMKALFEARRWAELGACLAPLRSLWFVREPLTVPEALAMAGRVLDAAEEIELTLLRVLRSESEGGVAQGSYQCRLGWFEPAALKQQEVSFDLHLGFDVGEAVTLRHLGVTTASAEPPLPVEREAAAASPAPAAARAAAAPGGAAAPPFVWSWAAGAQPGAGEMVMMYVPVLVPAGAAQALARAGGGAPAAAPDREGQ